jgi:hypothetical protein
MKHPAIPDDFRSRPSLSAARALRRSFATAELPEEKVEAIRKSRMDSRHAHIDKTVTNIR